jgi:multiple sugar transport system substrate-binding protein
MKRRTIIKSILVLLLLCAPLFAWAAATPVTLWDFLSGGDGVRWRAIIDAFNTSQSDIFVNATTLTWGVPFYTKVHTAVVAGDTPDVMTYHISHFPAGIKAGDLRPITAAELASVGLKFTDFNPALVNLSLDISKTYGKAGVIYGIPLDTHTSILYYNKDILKQAGLLGADGKPTGFTGIAQFTKSLQKIKDSTGMLPIAMSSSNDPATVWRMFYTLYSQQGGKLAVNGQLKLDQLDTFGKTAMETIGGWAKDGLIPPNVDYPGSVALFTTGKAAFMFNGNWEVPTVVDMKAKGTLPFDYGLMAFPMLYGSQATWADSHNIAIPNNQKNPISPAMLKTVLTWVAYVEKHAVAWAGGGHLPAYLPTLNGAELKMLSPVNQYSAQAAKDVTLEPVSPVFGVGAPAYDFVANYLTPVLLGQIEAGDAVSQFKAQLLSAAE